MKIGIIGSGAIGLYYGSMLQKSGQDVHFLMRRDYQAVSNDGLQVYSTKGDFHLAEVNAWLTAEEIGPVDLVLVALKTFSNHNLVRLVTPLVGSDTAILTLQNGLGNEELLAKEFGAKRVLGGIAFICSNRGEPGTVHHLGEGKISLGEFSNGLTPRCQQLAEMFNQAGVRCEAVDDLRRIRWEKLLWNIPFNGLTALFKQDVTELIRKPSIKELAFQLMLEVAAAANAQPLKKKIDAEVFCSKLISATEKMIGYRPSMMIDRLEGRPLELEAIYKIPLDQAHAAGIKMPCVEMLYQLLSAGE
jgi:2-dehydropantoate 2-reductase